MKTLDVIGCGRVGLTLARLWQTQGSFAVQDLHGRSTDNVAQAAAFMGGGRPVAELAAMRPADVWMLTVPDTPVAAVAAELAQRVPVAAAATAPPCKFRALPSARSVRWRCVWRSRAQPIDASRQSVRQVQ